MVIALYFTATWCGPCTWFKPQATQILKDAGVLVEEVDIDESPDYTSAAQVMSVPTIVFVKDNKEIQRVVGASVPLLNKTLTEVSDAGQAN